MTNFDINIHLINQYKNIYLDFQALHFQENNLYLEKKKMFV